MHANNRWGRQDIASAFAPHFVRSFGGQGYNFNLQNYFDEAGEDGIFFIGNLCKWNISYWGDRT